MGNNASAVLPQGVRGGQGFRVMTLGNRREIIVTKGCLLEILYDIAARFANAGVDGIANGRNGRNGRMTACWKNHVMENCEAFFRVARGATKEWSDLSFAPEDARMCPREFASPDGAGTFSQEARGLLRVHR